jgi:hypothetical protein
MILEMGRWGDEEDEGDEGDEGERIRLTLLTRHSSVQTFHRNVCTS